LRKFSFSPGLWRPPALRGLTVPVSEKRTLCPVVLTMVLLWLRKDRRLGSCNGSMVVTFTAPSTSGEPSPTVRSHRYCCEGSYDAAACALCPSLLTTLPTLSLLENRTLPAPEPTLPVESCCEPGVTKFSVTPPGVKAALEEVVLVVEYAVEGALSCVYEDARGVLGGRSGWSP
jgi:hypothetical protein